jgi:nucleotide-binding universal stress UspA family protein
MRLNILARLGAPATLNPWDAVVRVNIDAIRTDIERCLDAVVAKERSRHAGLEIVAEVVLAAPRSELVAQAARSELLVLGTTGAGAIASLLFGSVGAAVG